MRGEIAHGKAYGALALGMGSRALFQRAQEQAYFVSAVNTMAQGRLVPVPGGVLIQDGGALLGAVGVSGDTSDNDEYLRHRRHRGRRIEGQRGIADCRRGHPAATPSAITEAQKPCHAPRTSCGSCATSFAMTIWAAPGIRP